MIDIKAREARHVALDFVVRFHRDDDSSPWEAVQAEQDAWIAQQKSRGITVPVLKLIAYLTREAHEMYNDALRQAA